jgi:hypothetical protein
MYSASSNVNHENDKPSSDAPIESKYLEAVRIEKTGEAIRRAVESGLAVQAVAVPLSMLSEDELAAIPRDEIAKIADDNILHVQMFLRDNIETAGEFLRNHPQATLRAIKRKPQPSADDAQVPALRAIARNFGLEHLLDIKPTELSPDQCATLAALFELKSLPYEMGLAERAPEIFGKPGVVAEKIHARADEPAKVRGPYATLGPRLRDLGYSCVPIIPATKRPGELQNGSWVGLNDWRALYTARLPTDDEMARWSASDAGIGLVCGPASHGIVGVDLDTDDAEIQQAVISKLPPKLVKVGSKGGTLFYRRPAIDRSPSWNLTLADGKRVRVCDLLGTGRQTLLPPTIHPDTGQPYRWTGSVALEDMSPEDLPELLPEHLDAIGEALRPFGWQAERKPEQQTGSGASSGASIFEDPFRCLNEDALANLHKWVPALSLYKCRPARGGYEAVATWRASSTGQALERRKLNLKIHPKGIVDEGANKTYTPIDLVKAALDCDFDTACNFLTDRLSGWGDLPDIQFGDSPAIAPDMPPHDPETAPGVAADAPRVSGLQDQPEVKKVDPEADVERLEELTYVRARE